MCKNYANISIPCIRLANLYTLFFSVNKNKNIIQGNFAYRYKNKKKLFLNH